ncbi:MAG: MgtC/SapB family protein [Erysipelotrichaceae bacterium]|nr:MgtC/SapB family protein [Erysipelotrichaceae bacterium]
MTTIDQIIAEKLGAIQFGDWPFGNFILCVIALVLSLVLCGLIGYEREIKGSNAGFRTHLLVGIGSCVIMIVSIYGFPAVEGTKRDVARLAAAVVTGVGFLGAGAIMHRNAGITGLTTAATIWVSMAIGLACGSMNFILATGGTILILIVLITLGRFEVYFSKKKGPQITLKATRNVPVISHLLEISEQSECSIHNLQMESLEGDEI